MDLSSIIISLITTVGFIAIPISAIATIILFFIKLFKKNFRYTVFIDIILFLINSSSLVVLFLLAISFSLLGLPGSATEDEMMTFYIMVITIIILVCIIPFIITLLSFINLFLRRGKRAKN